MRILITLLFLSAFSTATLQAQWWKGNNKSINGNGEVVTQSRDLDGFDGVKVCCSIQVELMPGDFEVVVQAESNLQEYIRTDVAGKKLDIGFVDGVSINNKHKIVVYVTLPELELIDASSSAKVMTMETFRGDRLEIEASSGSKVKADYNGKKVSADASSGADIALVGKANEVRAEASSGADVDAGDLRAASGVAQASSGAEVRVHASESLRADASSGGRVSYGGNPGDLDSNSSSGGKVRKR